MSYKATSFVGTIRTTLIILACAGLAGASGAIAQQEAQKPAPTKDGSPIPQIELRPEPETTTASFGDWILKCLKTKSAEPSQECEVTHSVLVQGQPGPILQLAVGKATGAAGHQLIVVLPTNVLLTAKPSVEIDGNDTAAATASWLRCIPGACFAQVPVDRSRWLGSERGTIKYFDAANREMAIPFSFRGMKQALDALSKS